MESDNRSSNCSNMCCIKIENLARTVIMPELEFGYYKYYLHSVFCLCVCVCVCVCERERGRVCVCVCV